MFKGYASQLKLNGDEVAYATVEPVRQEQHAASVLAHQFVRLIASDAAEAASAERDIKAAAHSAQKGDVIRVTSGAYSGREVKVRSVSTDNIYLVDKITLANTDTFEIYRHKYPTVNVDGKVETTATLSGSIQYDLNGSDVEVHQDTGTPANSRPLPVQYLNSLGVRTNLATETTVATLATQATLAALLTELQLKADLSETQPVSAASLPLPTGAATSANQSTEITHLNAIETATEAIQSNNFTQLAALLTELQLKADLSENQPVALKDGSGNSVTSEAVGSKRALNVIDVGLVVVDFLDTTEVLDTSSSNIQASGTAIGSVTVRVASLAAACSAIKVNDTTGEYIGIYDDDALVAIIGPGDDQVIPARIAAGSVIKLRNMANAAISTGKLCLQFLG